MLVVTQSSYNRQTPIHLPRFAKLLAISPKHPDLLEFFITSIPNHVTLSLTSLNYLPRDHSPILITVDGSLATNNRPCLIVDSVNWTAFEKILNDSISYNCSLFSGHRQYCSIINQNNLKHSHEFFINPSLYKFKSFFRLTKPLNPTHKSKTL